MSEKEWEIFIKDIKKLFCKLLKKYSIDVIESRLELELLDWNFIDPKVEISERDNLFGGTFYAINITHYTKENHQYLFTTLDIFESNLEEYERD